MARTTLAAVRVILGDHVEIGDVDLFAHITTANTLVTAELGTSGLGDAHLAEIEKHLAAHFASVADLPPGVLEQALTGLPPLDGTSSGRLRAAASFLESWEIKSGSIFIHNSGPAIEILDSGEGSAQAQQGILDPATAAVRAEFGLG